MPELTIGLTAAHRGEGGQSLPVHPQHLASLHAEVRGRLFFETGYGTPFGLTDDDLARVSGGVCTRRLIFSECDVVLLYKPVLEDFLDLTEGQILWGFPHFEQAGEPLRAPLERRHAVIAREPSPDGSCNGPYAPPIGEQLEEMAAYGSVTHALACTGRTGRWGPPVHAVVLGDGPLGDGAVAALQAQGITGLTRVTKRFPAALDAAHDGVRTVQLVVDDAGECHAVSTSGHLALPDLLAQHDLIVNCLGQDADAPLPLPPLDQASPLRPGTLVVDVSREQGAGLGRVRPAAFTPVRHGADGVQYYAADDHPSYWWNSATWMLSRAILPHLGTVASGRARWLAQGGDTGTGL
ncbi:alanine dehydrogenase [Streptomyces sp. MNP-20]|uniref:alanine dehydrogenase n=1 Tax=Streptomyces sp. MNP-20 TaxID=2721165 RepID=UPI001555FD71|nr:alanine dehydrogenase [Streptomyces sp. MNP-20]